jgi:hypothetical protein
MHEETAEIEGGSDSESEGEDLSKEETHNLFAQILKRTQEQSIRGGYIIREKRKARAARLPYKKK